MVHTRFFELFSFFLLSAYTRICIYIYICVCVCVYKCVRGNNVMENRNERSRVESQQRRVSKTTARNSCVAHRHRVVDNENFSIIYAPLESRKLLWVKKKLFFRVSRKTNSYYAYCVAYTIYIIYLYLRIYLYVLYQYI